MKYIFKNPLLLSFIILILSYQLSWADTEQKIAYFTGYRVLTDMDAIYELCNAVRSNSPDFTKELGSNYDRNFKKGRQVVKDTLGKMESCFQINKNEIKDLRMHAVRSFAKGSLAQFLTIYRKNNSLNFVDKKRLELIKKGCLEQAQKMSTGNLYFQDKELTCENLK